MGGYKVLFTLLLGLLTLVDASCDAVNSSIDIKNVDRNIDITTQLVKVYNIITLENSADGPVSNFLFGVEPEIRDHLAFVRVQVGGNTLKTPLSGPEKTIWCIDLKNALQPGKTVVVEVEIIFTHMLFVYPDAIKQKDIQLIRYYGNHYFYSPYAITKQLTTVNLGAISIESYTNLEPVSKVNSVISYGPYEKVAPFTVDKMLIHYANNSPFLTVTSLERLIEVSHWGNIAVEETIHLKHTGATLKGPFSRYEYMTDAQSGLSSIASIKTILPASATDIYYKDTIGKISTFEVKVMDDYVEVTLSPRFPLFGGWQTNYVIGYNVPTYEYLYNEADTYLLRMRVLDPIYEDMVVDELTVKVILPEGSNNVELSTPYPVERLADSRHPTYLDIKGRQVVTFVQKNLVEDHIEDFELLYNFSRVLMLQEPLIIISAFYTLLIFVIFFAKLDFTIIKESPVPRYQSHEKTNFCHTKKVKKVTKSKLNI